MALLTLSYTTFLLGKKKPNWIMYVVVGLMFFAIYYFTFRLLITKLNLKTIGREDDGQETKLYSKQDYKESKGSKDVATQTGTKDTGLASTIVGALGGADNIQSVTNCYTRLRLVLEEPDKVDESVLKNETGANGIIVKGQNVHVVYGLQVENVRKAVDKYLGITEEE